MQSISRFILPGLLLLLSGCEGKPQQTYQWQHSDGSYAATFSGDGQFLLSADVDAAARLWDLQNNQVKYSWQSEQKETVRSTSVALAKSSPIAATVEFDTVMLWNTQNGMPENRLTFPLRIKSLDISPDGRFLLLALADSTAVYFDITANRVRHVFEHDGAAVDSPVKHPINAVAISPDGKTALTGGDDRTARLWDLQNGQQLQNWLHGNSVNLVKFDPQSRFVFTAADNDHSYLWSLADGSQQSQLRSSAWPKSMPIPDFPVFTTTTTAVNFSQDGMLLVTGHAAERLCVWQLPQGDKLRCWKVTRQNPLNPGMVIQAVSFVANDSAVLSIAGTGEAQQWQWR